MTDTQYPARVAVIGGGRMGAGIAQVFATIGSRIEIAESGDREAATNRVATGLRRAAERGKLEDASPEDVLARVSTVASPADIDAETDLVVEAVPEDARLKIDVLTQAEKVVAPTAVLASNTSSLSIAELGSVLVDPSRFLGMHFFNPVPVSELVEIVTTPVTSSDVADRAIAWVHLLGKVEVVVRDSPGFATSRLGVALGIEAIRMLEEGVADAASIDRAMELGYRHPMGPLRSTDLVGLDVRLAIADHLAATLGPRFAPPQLLRDKVARGELGRKSGRGFHD
ncbi:3-hydroxyacyl-CoA dehydrogenase family protein [Rhodococcus rhodnii]|uniref:3-hydroxyacyl-CoA dehydrogenase n=2 Tax=Rhodococcus rhodnii TaxID=38312 RepID=R7WLK2_9NOCA|nr:3-hydroxyacyl-CoA dehydrogenase family protein [Rhodococcus rhodnii]EOM76170.1 3-hydroxyacyl-CoA dehydrogenase [Rhodococcus rhodnii LMG 5362]TXG91813.1 3-hydroxyacyl-CoA dehydrogenase family protein [Rhodococcus rhodnii]